MSVIIQIANIGPIAYGVIRWYYQKRTGRPINPAITIYPLLAIGCTASLLLIFFWEETAYVNGEEHSVALFTLVRMMIKYDNSSFMFDSTVLYCTPAS